MLKHSIFQTEVQFNAPTPSNHPSGSDYQTSHPTGEPPLEWTGSGSRAQPSTQIIGIKNDRIIIWPAQADGKANRAYWNVQSSITEARNSIEDSGKHWIDKASGKVPKPKKKTSKKRSWRSRFKAFRRRYKW